jgi:hypothetical protein
LPTPQRWTLLDRDAELLARVRAPGGDVQVKTRRGDLADFGLVDVIRTHLVTASALLDLVSERWLSRVVDACAEAGCAALFALSYDGTAAWEGDVDRLDMGDSLDELVRDAVNAHQLRDKGLGAALGPAAVPVAEELFRQRGYRTFTRPSPWMLGPGETALVGALIEGWATAAAEQRPAEAPAVRRWAESRMAQVATGDFGLVVGHLDVLALPPRPAARAASAPA